MWKSLEKEWKNVYERSDILRQSSSGMKNFPGMHFSPSHGENNSILIISRFYRLVEEISYHVFRSDKERLTENIGKQLFTQLFLDLFVRSLLLFFLYSKKLAAFKGH